MPAMCPLPCRTNPSGRVRGVQIAVFGSVLLR